MCMRRIFILFFVCAVSATAVFSFPQVIKEYTETNTAIEARVGETFVITLGSNRTTGFAWQLAEDFDNNILELVNSEYIVNDSKLIGAGGKEKFIFKTRGAGKAAISLNYVRAWEENAAPARKMIFTITVK